MCVQFLTRFSKIAIQGKGPDGNWARKQLVYRKAKNLRVIRPPDICVNLVVSIFTLLAAKQYVDNLFHSLTVL